MGFQDALIVPSSKNSDLLKRVKSNLITKLKNGDEGLSIDNAISLFENGFFSKSKSFIFYYLLLVAFTIKIYEIIIELFHCRGTRPYP